MGKSKNNNEEKPIAIKLDDLCPRDNVKGGKGKTVFGSIRSAGGKWGDRKK